MFHHEGTKDTKVSENYISELRIVNRKVDLSESEGSKAAQRTQGLFPGALSALCVLYALVANSQFESFVVKN